MSDEEKEKINQETVEKQEGVKSPESMEKEPKTVEEEIESKKSVVEAAAKEVKETGEGYKKKLENNDALLPQKEKFEERESIINAAANIAKGEYDWEVKKLLEKNIPETQNVGVCSKCGAEIQEGANFCAKCGAELLKEKQEGQGENKEEVSAEKTKERILQDLEKINGKIIFAKTSGELKELNDQREELIRSTDKDFDASLSEKIGEQGDSLQRETKDAGKEFEDIGALLNKELGNIAKELVNKESLLFKIMERLRETEVHIEKLEKSLAELKKIKESDARTHAIEVHEASLESEKKELAKIESKVKKITLQLKDNEQ